MRLCLCGCGREIKRGAKGKFASFILGHHTRVIKPKNWKGGKPNCADCGRKLSTYACKRCVQCHGKSQSGVNNPMYGKKRLDLSRFNRKTKSELLKRLWKEERKRMTQEGERNSAWRGGVTPEYSKTFTKYWWQKKRAAVIKRDGGICRRCKKPGNSVDHIIPWRVSRDNLLSNLQLLCNSCNAKKSWEDAKIW